jgi:hypothetical protein
MTILKKVDHWQIQDDTGLHRFDTEEEALEYEKAGKEGRATWYGEVDGSEEKEDNEEEASSDE